MPDIWQDFLKIVREEAGSRVVETWFKAVTLHEWDKISNTVYLVAPNTFVKNWINKNYFSLLQTHLGRLLNIQSPRIVLLDLVDKNKKTEKKEPSVELRIQPAHVSNNTKNKTDSNKSIHNALTKASRNPGHINHTYSFDTFVVGPSNSLSYAAAHAVAEKPGLLYNPLFIYGGSGLGKTHLLHAIGNEIRKKNKGAKILYQPTDRFVNEFINAIRFDKVHRFKQKYHSIDVLMIDDVQFIANKEQTQEAFFHIFNSLYEAHKQIILSSDVVPKNIGGIAERLRSRLGWGLVTDIHAPRLETKVAILKKKAEQSNAQLPDSVAHFIASQEMSNIRELEGALIRIMAFSSLTQQPVTLELAQKVFLSSATNTTPQDVSLDRIMRCVCNHYPYTFEDIRSKNRNKDLTFVRHLIMFLMKKYTHKSLRDIGAFLGGRNHATVMHGLDKMEEYIISNPGFNEKIKDFEKKIGQ